MPFIETLGQQMAGQAAGGVLGLFLGGMNDQRQYEQQQRLNVLNREMIDYQYNKQYDLWQKTSYPGQIEQMKKAGLNPGLLYGMGGAGGGTTGSGGGGGSQASGHSGEAMALMNGINAAMSAAQIENLKAQTEKTKAEATKIAGVDTSNVEADTSLKKINAEILKIEKAFQTETFDTRITQLDNMIELTKAEAIEISQRVGIQAEQRDALVMEAKGKALQAVIQNALIGEQIKATQQQITESKERVKQIEEQIKQTWFSLNMQEKQMRVKAIMDEVAAANTGQPAGNVSWHDYRSVTKQIDKIMNIGKEDFK